MNACAGSLAPRGLRPSIPNVAWIHDFIRGNFAADRGAGAMEEIPPRRAERQRRKQTGKGAQVSTEQDPAQDLGWLVTDFVDRVHDAAHAVVVSADGFVLAFSATFPREHADLCAAVTSALAGLAQGAARTFHAGEVIQTAVQMEAGLLMTMPAANGSTLAVLAAAECDLGLIAYEMTLLVQRAGRELAPAARQNCRPKAPLPGVPPQAGFREASDPARDPALDRPDLAQRFQTLEAL